MRRSLLKSNVRCRAIHSSTTPRLLAKCAGRIDSTRTSSSRISSASCRSWPSLRRCRSAGEPMDGSRGAVISIPSPSEPEGMIHPICHSAAGTVAMARAWSRAALRAAPADLFSTVPVEHTVGQLDEPAPCRSQRRQVFPGLPAEALGSTTTLFDTEKARVGQFTTFGILTHPLPGLLGLPFHVQQIIGDLKRLAKTLSIGIETSQEGRSPDVGYLHRIALERGPDSQPQSSAEQGPRLAGMDRLQVFQPGAYSRALKTCRCQQSLPGHVVHLPSDH